MNSLQLDSLAVPAPSTIRGQPARLNGKGALLAYGANRSAILRSLDPAVPSRAFPCASLCTVARLSPSQQFLATGEANGTVKLWDLTSPELKIAHEFKNGGRVADLCWDGESQRIAFVGEGKERFGSVYSLSTGTQVGEISGHNRVVNSVAMRQQRPFRIITGSDDCTTIILNGVPFKYASASRKHTRFVQSVDYSSDGSLSASAGSDGCVYLYAGTDGADHAALVDPALPTAVAHSGTVFSVSFSPDSKSLLTSSADQTTKLWDVATGAIVRSWKFDGVSLACQQVGSCWVHVDGKEQIVSLSFNGDLNVLEKGIKEPVRILYGHQQAATALTYLPASKTFYSGDAAGVARSWTAAGVCSPVKGAGHSNLVIDLVPTNESIVSIGMDDTVRSITSDGFSSHSFAADSLPKALVHSGSTSYLLSSSSLVLLSDTLQASHTHKLSFNPTALAVSSAELVAVGDDTGKVHLFQKEGGTLKETGLLEKSRSAVSALTFAPDGSLAVGESSGKILLFDVQTKEVIQNRFVFHTARINSLAFSRAGDRLLSGSLDGNVMIYSLATPSRVLSAKGAHSGGVNAVLWEGEDKVASAGADGCMRSWIVQK